MNETREGVAIFGPDGECRFASEGFDGWVGQPLILGRGDSLAQALSRIGISERAGSHGIFDGPRGAFFASVEHVEDVAVVRVRPVERQEAMALRGRFLSVASHDLRGVLANVRSYASLLRGPRFGLQEKALRAVDIIARNSDKALALAEDIFDALKAEGGTLRVERSVEPLRPLLEQAVERCRPAASEKEVDLSLETGALEETVEVDPDRFGRACTHLLAHAVWRTPENGRAGLVASSSGGRLQISAWDEGTPPTGDELRNAFARDARVAQERSLAGGFRLCLAAALARALGGDVGAHVDGHGRQNFFFTLPVHSTEQPGLPA